MVQIYIKVDALKHCWVDIEINALHWLRQTMALWLEM